MDKSCSDDSDSEHCGYFVFTLKSTEKLYPLQESEEHIIGSSSGANIRITTKIDLEPIHSIVNITENGVVTITNKSMANPVKVNNVAIKDYKVLKDQDLIEVAGRQFKYITDSVSEQEIDKYIKHLQRKISAKKPPSSKTKIPSRIPSSIPIGKSRRKSDSAFNTRRSPVSTRKISASAKKVPASAGKNASRVKKPATSAKKSVTHAKKSLLENLEKEALSPAQKSQGGSSKLVDIEEVLQEDPLLKDDESSTRKSVAPVRKSLASIRKSLALKNSSPRNSTDNRSRKSKQSLLLDEGSFDKGSLLTDDEYIASPSPKKTPAKTTNSLESAKKTPINARNSLTSILKSASKSSKSALLDDFSLEEQLLMTDDSTSSPNKNLDISLVTSTKKAHASARKSLASAKKSLHSIRQSLSHTRKSLYDDFLSGNDSGVSRATRKSGQSILIDLDESASPIDSPVIENDLLLESDSRKSTPISTKIKGTPASTRKSLASIKKTPASTRKPTTRRSLSVDLLLEDISSAKKSIARKSSIRKSLSDEQLLKNRKSTLNEDSLLKNDDISGSLYRTRNSRANASKSRQSILINLDEEDPKNDSSARARRSSFKNNKSERENEELNTPDTSLVSEGGDRRSGMSSAQKSANFETPDSRWSTKTMHSTHQDLEDSEVEAYITRKSAHQIGTPTTPEMAVQEFETSTAKKSFRRSKSLTERTPIDEHDYHRKSLSDRGKIEDLEEAFPTKRLGARRTASTSYRVQTPGKSQDESMEYLDLPSPIAPEKRLCKSLLSKFQTPDRTRRLTKSLLSSATKPGVRWSKSLVSIHTPNETKTSTRSQNTTIEEDVTVEEIDDLSNTNTGPRRSKSLIKTQSPAQDNVSIRSRKSTVQDEEYLETNNKSRVSSRSRRSVPLGEEAEVESPQDRISSALRKSSVRTEMDALELLSSPTQSIRLSKSFQASIEPKVKTPQGRLSSTSRKSSIQNQSNLEEDLEADATFNESRVSSRRSASLGEAEVESPQARISSASRKSSVRTEMDALELLSSPTQSIRLSKSFQASNEPKVKTPQGRLSSISRKSSIQNQSNLEEDLEADVAFNESRVSSRSRKSAPLDVNLSKLKIPQGRISSASRKSSVKTEMDVLELLPSPAGDIRSSESFPALSESKLNTRQSRVSSTSRKSAIQDESNLEEHLEADATLNESRVSSRSRKSVLQGEKDSKVKTPQSRLSSTSRKSAVQDESNLEEHLEADATFNESRVSSRSRKSLLQGEEDLKVKTPQSRLSSTSRKSALQDESNLEEHLEADATFNEPRVSSRSRKSVPQGKEDSKVKTPQSRLLSTSRKSAVQEESNLEEHLESDATFNESRLSSRSRKSLLQGEEDSKVKTPQSRLSSTSRKSAVQDESNLDEDLETDTTLNESRYSSRSRKSVPQGEEYSKVKTPEARISYTSRKSAVQDESKLEDLETDTTLNESRYSSRSRKSVPQGEEYSKVKTPQARISSASRKSSVKTDMDDLEILPSPRHSRNRSKSFQLFSESGLSKSRKSAAEVFPEADVSMDDEVFASPSEKTGRQSKSLLSVQRQNESRISSRSRKSTTQSESVLGDYPESEVTLSSSRTSTANESMNKSRSRKSTAQDDDTVKIPVHTRMSSKSRKSSGEDESIEVVEIDSSLNDSDIFTNETANTSETLVPDETPNVSIISTRSRKSAAAQDYSTLEDYPESESRLSAAQSRKSSRSTKSFAKDVSNLEITLSPSNAADVLSKFQTPNDSRISSRSRKSTTTQDESHLEYLEDNPSPVQIDVRIANSLLSKTYTTTEKVTSRYETNVEDDFPSPISLEKRRTKSLSSNTQVNDSRRSSRLKKSTTTDDFEYTFRRGSKSDLSKTQINENTIDDPSSFPVGLSRSKISLSGFDETTSVEESGSSKFVTTRNLKRSFNDDSQTYSAEGTTFNVLDNTRKSTRNSRTLNRSQEDSIISIDDSVEDTEDLDTSQASTRSKSIPYQPITEDITPASGKNVLRTQNSPNNDLTNVAGVKKLFATPKEAKSPKNDLTKIPHLGKFVSPREQKGPDNRLSDFTGVKRLLKSPQKSPKNCLSDMYGVKKLLKTPKPTKKKLLNDLGLKRLMATPKLKKVANRMSDFEGVAQIFNITTQRLSNNSDIENNEELFSKIFERQPLKTYRSKSVSPEKKIDAYGATRKSIHDEPFVSPRVEDWVEEQTALKRKLEETDTKNDQKQAMEESEEEPVTKKAKLATPEKVNEEHVADDESDEDNEPCTAKTIKKVKKKVTYLEEITYYDISPAPAKTRKGKAAAKEKKPAKTAKSKKEPISEEQEPATTESEPSRSRRGRPAKKADEVDQKNVKAAEKKPARSKRIKKLIEEDIAVPEGHPQTDTPEKPTGRTRRAKKESESTPLLSEEKPSTPVENKPARLTRNKKVPEFLEPVVPSPKLSTPLKSIGKRDRKEESTPVKIEQEEASGRSRRGAKISEIPEESRTTKTKTRGKKQEDTVEEAIEQKASMSRRGKNAAKVPETPEEPKESAESTPVIREQENASGRSRRGAKIAETPEKPKATKTRGTRGKKQEDTAEEVPEIKDSRSRRAKTESISEEIEETTKPGRKTRGKKDEADARKGKLVEEVIEEKAPSRTARGRNVAKVLETPTEEPKTRTKKEESAESTPAKREQEDAPGRSRRGAKIPETPEGPKATKTRATRGKKQEDTVEEVPEGKASRSRRAKTESVSEEIEETTKPARKTRGKKDEADKITKEKEKPTLVEEVIEEKAPSRSGRGRKRKSVEREEAVEDIDEMIASSRSKRGKKEAVKAPSRRDRKEIAQEDPEEVIGEEQPVAKGKGKKKIEEVEEKLILPKRGKKESVPEETGRGKSKRVEKEEPTNKKKKVEESSEDTPIRTRSTRRAAARK